MSAAPEPNPRARRRRVSDTPVTALGSVIVAVFTLTALLVHAIMPLSTFTTIAIILAGTLSVVQGLRYLGTRDEVLLVAVVLGAAVLLRVLFGVL